MTEQTTQDERTVWVIEQGDYSDYRVVGVFSSRENAERVCEAMGRASFGDAPSVAEWPLDPVVDALNQGHSQFTVHMLRDGTTEEVRSAEMSGYELAGRCWLWRRSTAPAYRGQGIPDVLSATVWAADTQHAVKIANEKRVQMIANGEWPEVPHV